MTAEIAILSRSAVALAADSASTVTRQISPTETERRVLKGANKLFALSRREPVAVMIFGAASFMGVPWETLIKMYRADRAGKAFNTLAEYPTDFFSFLESHPNLFPDDAQEKAARSAMLRYAFMVLGQAIGKYDSSRKTGKREMNRIVGEEIDAENRYVNKCKFARGFDRTTTADLINKYDAHLTKTISDVFGAYTVSKPRIKTLKTILVAAISKIWFNEASAGIVFAGFGTSDHYPRLVGHRCQGLFENTLLRTKREQKEISNENPAEIVPFAQTEMVQTFLWGIDPDILKAVEGFISASFGEFRKNVRQDAPAAATSVSAASKAIRKQFDKDFVEYISANHAQPIYRIIDVLSKSELAELAETLINMESLKKRITQPIESVGGPVDVAVISKAEGVIWIKRKHYFDPDLNQDFFSRLSAK